MIGLGLFGLLAGALESAIAAYAWRLNKAFGTHRVGWSLFSAFLFLALLHWLGSAESLGAASGTPELVSLLILILLLVGMAHTEVVLAERLRMERKQSIVGSQLQSQFDENAALKQAYESLRKQAADGKHGEQILKASEQQYRLLFNENPQPMWIFDLRSFRFLAVNKAALRNHGYNEQEFLALKAKDLVRTTDSPAFEEDSARPSSGIQSRGRSWLYKKDRSLLELEITSYDMFFADCPARLILTQDASSQPRVGAKSPIAEELF